MRTYIGRTQAYYDGDDGAVFTPQQWKCSTSPGELAGEVHVLTPEGEELFDKWCDDMSCGYDLCNGRAKGLAAQYSSEQMWSLLTDPSKGYSQVYN